MSKITAYAMQELELAGLFDKNSAYEGLIGTCVMQMVRTFDDQNHSGESAKATREIFTRISQHLPLTDLTGEESEWEDVSEISGYELFQNKRCYQVFRDEKGAFDVEGIIFKCQDGSKYTNSDSHVRIEFPYMPIRKYVEEPIVDSPSDMPAVRIEQ